MFEGDDILRRNFAIGGNKYPHGQALPIQKPIKNCSLNDDFNARKEDHVD